MKKKKVKKKYLRNLETNLYNILRIKKKNIKN